MEFFIDGLPHLFELLLVVLIELPDLLLHGDTDILQLLLVFHRHMAEARVQISQPLVEVLRAVLLVGRNHFAEGLHARLQIRLDIGLHVLQRLRRFLRTAARFLGLQHRQPLLLCLERGNFRLRRAVFLQQQNRQDQSCCCHRC